MIDAWSREVLRQQAVEAWEQAKRLHHDAAALLRAAADVREVTYERRARFADERGTQTMHALRDSSQRRVVTRNTSSDTALQVLADLAIGGVNPINEDAETESVGAGLAASIDLAMLVRLEELLGRRLGYVVGAHDAGTALGLAIATQPDVALIDARLDLANGADLAIVLPLYATRTKTLLLTDDESLRSRARAAKVEVLSPQSSDQRLGAWIASFAA